MSCLIQKDLTNSDALNLAREVDREGLRTIGVLTKLDLMDKGTNAVATLNNQDKIKLLKGFIGVVNRSQEDIDNGKSLSDALDDEDSFFNDKPVYDEVKNNCGIKNLQRYLQKELTKHLFKELPSVRQDFDDKLFKINEKN